MGKYQPGDDVQMIEDQDQWPAWPMLPVKRRVDHNLECAIVWGTHFTEEVTTKITLLHTNMWGLNGLTAEQLAEIPRTVYESAAACVADGWIVD